MDLVVHACNHSTGEAEGQGQPGLRGKTLSQKNLLRPMGETKQV
jgi:hypothetical protein